MKDALFRRDLRTLAAFRVALAIVIAALALAVDLTSLLALHNFVATPSWLDATFVQAATIAKLAVLAVLCRRRLAAPGVARAIWILIVTIGMLLAYDLAAHWIASGDGPVSKLARRAVARTALGILIASTWLYLGNKLFQTDTDRFQGFGRPLAIASIVVGVAMLIYFFDTPKLLGHVLFDVSLAGLGVASIWPAAGLVTGRRRLILYSSVLTVPLLAWAAPFFFGVGAAVYENRERIATLGSESVAIEPATSLDQLLADQLPGFERLAQTDVFNDVWLFADGRALAVNNRTLFERAAGDNDWQARSLPKPEFDVSYLHFDRDGRRGVMGAGWAPPLRSTDGGRTWETVNAEEVFTKLAGREFGNRWSDDYSAVWLDPQTGRGSFMMGCRFFTTGDFAKSWKMTTLKTGDDKTRCPADSPFAVDLKLGLARATAMDAEYLLTRDARDSAWKELCAVDFEAFLVVGDVPACSDEGVLDDDARKFLQRDEHQGLEVTRQPGDIDTVFEFLHNGELDETTSRFALRDNGRQTWLSGAGFLVTGHPETGFFADYLVPPLATIAPLDRERALGVGDNEAYATANGGRSWRRLAPSDMAIYNVLTTPERIYLLGDTELLAWSGGNLEPVLTRPDYDDFSLLTGSSDGRHVIVVDGPTMFVSNDGGLNFQTRLMPAVPDAVDEDGDTWEVERVAADCSLVNEPRCVAVFVDGSALTFNPFSDDAPAALPAVPTDEDDYAEGWIAILGEAPNYVYLPYDTSRMYALDAHGQWHKDRLGLILETGRITLPAERNAMLIEEAPGEFLMVDPTGAAHLFDQPDWREGQDYLDDRTPCLDKSGSLALVGNHDGRLAISQDGGASWQESRANWSTGSACGLGGGTLWLLADGLSVYKKSSALVSTCDL